MKHIKYLFVALALAIFSPLMAGNSDFYEDDSTGVYHITSAQGILDFKALADVRVGLGDIYIMKEQVVLDNDIDMSKSSFSSITNFAGTFDGQGHTISGMTISVTSGNGLGFFKQISGATIKNVTFANATINKGITTGTAVGVVAGYATGSCIFENVHVTGSSVSANADIGGLVGWAKESANAKLDAVVTVKNCSIESTKLQGLLCVAGFCGFVQGTCDISGALLKDVTPTINGTIVKLDTTITCDGSATTCPGKGTVVKGRYMLYYGSYYAAYADLYTIAGDSTHNCSLACDGNTLKYSTIVHDAPYEVDGVLYSDKDAIPSVAKVGGTEYKTLEEALAALSAENHTLTLLDEEVWDAATPVYWSAGTQSGYAATFAEALTAAYKANEGDIKIVCRPNADVGALTHGHVADNLTVYGNNAYLSGGECDIEIDTYKYDRTTGAQSDDGAYLEQDITITAYELDNLSVWGQRNTSYTATINLTDCDGKAIEGQTNVQRVYLTGNTGANNITLTDCDFLTAATAVFSNADGAIVLKNCTFTGAALGVNINHTMGGALTVSVEDCTFTDCGNDGDYAQFAAPIRFVNSGSGTISATVTNTTITGTVGSNGDILLGDGRTGWNSNDVSLKVTETAASVQAQNPGYYDSDGTTDATKVATVTVKTDDTLETSIDKLLPTIDLDTFIKAVVESNYDFDGSKYLNGQGGVLTVKWSPVSGCFDTGREHTCTVNNVAATGNTPNRVNSHLAQFQLFEKITSAVSVKNVAFVYEPADFTICANSGWKGSGTAEDVRAGQLYLMNTGDVTFESCSFDKVVLTSFNCGETSTVTNCSFKNVYNSYAVKDIRGEKVSVTDCTFENCGAAIMVSATNATVAVNEVIISGNTFKTVDVSGTAPESDNPNENKVGTRGLIQIASSGDYSETTFDFSDNTATDCGPVIRQLNATVSLNAEERTILKELVTGDSSLYVSDSIRVAQIGETAYYSLADAFEAAESGDTIKLLVDLTETDAASSANIYNMAGVTFDLNGHTYSHNNNAHFFQGTGGVITNGTMVCLDGGSYALSVGNYEDATTSFTVADVTMIGGISVGCATGVVLEDLTVTGTDACAVEMDEGCSVTIKSGTYTAGEGALLNGNSNATLAIEGGTFTAGEQSLVGTTGLVPSISGGTFDTAIAAEYCASGFMPVKNDDGTYGVADAIQVLNADGSVVGTYHSLSNAFEVAGKSGATVKLLADLTETDAAGSAIIYDMTGVTFDLNGYTYSHYNNAHYFQGTGGTIKNGTVVCLDEGSYALSVGNYEGGTTSFTVKDVTITGGIDIGCATGVTLEDLTVTGTDACAVKVGESCSATIKSGTYTAGSTAVLDGYSGATLKIEGGTFYMNETALVNTEMGETLLDPLVPTISGGKFDTDLTTDTEKNYLADGLTTLYSESEKLYVIAPENSEIVTVETSEEADSGDSTKKNIPVVLSKAIVTKVLENAGVTDTSAATATEKTEALNKTDPNDNPVWVNLIAGIDSDKYVAVDAAQNKKESTIDVTPVNIEAVATTSAGVQFAYQVDEVKVATTDGKTTAEVAKAGEVVAAPAIDVDNVETSAYFQVKVLIRQNGSTLATVPATNYVGVLKKSTKMTKAIVPVPWHSLADGENISVSNIVKTANLSVGDKLYVYDMTDKKYNVYSLKEDKTWEPAAVYEIDENGQVSTTSSGKPESTRVARGSGVWLERQDTSTPIVTYGLAASAKQDTELAAGGSKESPTWNLVAVPSTEPMELNDIALPENAANDTIIVPTEGVPRIYTVEADGKWGYEESTEVADGAVFVERKVEENATLPAGTGFWYLNGSDTEKKVNW